MSKALWCAVLFSVGSTVANAQGSAVLNPVYQRAQTMVNEGNAAGGRALVDSMIAVATPGSNDYAEGVYWRAVLAATAADAEMDYKRIVIDHPLSPRVEDALIRLAQLEIARANYDAALGHLNRLAIEHPESPARGRAGYWAARALFDKNDIQGGCLATADALARTPESDTELRNQISYLNQRCVGVVLVTPNPQQFGIPGAVPVTAGAANPIASGSGTSPAGVSTPVPVNTPAVMPAPSPAVSSAATSAQAIVRVDSASRKEQAKTTNVSGKTVSTMKTASPPKTSPPKTSQPKESRDTTSSDKSARIGYSVQVAAYNVKSQADAMAVKLRKRGYEARVDGTAAPFRVRIGKYETQAQASAVQRSLKAKQITGFVVQAEIR